MKTILKISFVLFCCMYWNSCSKDDDSETSAAIEKSPTAVASLDNSNGGVYKGIIVGSLGCFKISLKNGNSEVSCKLKFDKNEVFLTNTSLANWQPGQMFNTETKFTGKLNNQDISLSFSCNTDGSNPYITLYIPNHSTVTWLYKEKSGVHVKCYEGTYSIKYTNSTETGEWAVVCNHQMMRGYMKGPDGKMSIYGTITGKKVVIDEGVELQIDDNTLSGSWTDEDGGLVTISGKRSL